MEFLLKNLRKKQPHGAKCMYGSFFVLLIDNFFFAASANFKIFTDGHRNARQDVSVDLWDPLLSRPHLHGITSIWIL